MGGGLGSIGWLFILIFFGIMSIACIGISWVGIRLINDLGRYPSKTPAIQMGVMFKVVIIEVVSMTLLVLFFKLLVAE